MSVKKESLQGIILMFIQHNIMESYSCKHTDILSGAVGEHSITCAGNKSQSYLTMLMVKVTIVMVKVTMLMVKVTIVMVKVGSKSK